MNIVLATVRSVSKRQLLLLILSACLQAATRVPAGTIYQKSSENQYIRVCEDCNEISSSYWEEGDVSALAVDASSGTVYAATPGGVTKNTHSGTSLLVGGIQDVSCLTMDFSGNLYALVGSGVVFKITQDTNVSAVANLPGAAAIVFDQTDNLYSANGTNVSKTLPGGSTIPFASLLGEARGGAGLAFDSVGNLLVDTSIGVERIAPNGTNNLYISWASSATNGPWSYHPPYVRTCGDGGICLDEVDNLYFNVTWDRSTIFSGELDTMKCEAGTDGGIWTLWCARYGYAPCLIAYSPLDPVPSILMLPPGATAPSISSGPQSETVLAYSAAFFTVAAIGSPLNYQWSFNGTNIPGATSSSLSVPSVTPADLGLYTVVISNVLGIASSNAVLSMYPFLAVPFGGAVAYWGKPATFSVEAWGTGPLSYQWLKDGVALPGATADSLSLSSVQLTDAGLYSVVVSSALGSVTNPPTQVVVNPAGVSLGFCPALTIDGVTGYSYIIDRTADLVDTNSWVTLTNLTLTQPVQLWVDTNVNASSPFESKYFYRVLPGQ